MLRLTFLFLSISIAFISQAQLTDEIDPSTLYVVKDYPKGKILRQCDSVFLYSEYIEDKTCIFLLCGQDPQRIIGQVCDDKMMYNPVKNYKEVIWKNDTIYFGSQMPFRATEINYTLGWDGKTLTLGEEDVYDPSWVAVQEAEELIEKGDLKAAMGAYEEVMYPHAYINDAEVSLNLIFAARKWGTKYYREKNYAKATALVDDAKSYWFIDAFPWNEVHLGIEERYPLTDSITTALAAAYSDFSLFFLRDKNYDRAVTLGLASKSLKPDYANPYLQLGDAFYALGEKKEARNAYKTYRSLLEKSGEKLPSRVHKRILESN